MNEKNKAAGVSAQAALQNKIDMNNTSASNQRLAILAELRAGPQTTITLRQHGVMHPAARIQELKQQGHNIQTVRVASVTPDGVLHRSVAKYVLLADVAAKVAA
jgi:Helix-turn-helix domain